MRLRTLPLTLKSAPASQDGVPVFSMLDATDVVDRHGDRMNAAALRLPPGATDVPLYWEHAWQSYDPKQRMPIGRAKVWRDGDQWYMTPLFDEVDELSRTVKAKVAAGTITACSVGTLDITTKPNGQGKYQGGVDVQEAELIEVSLCGIGAKAGARRVKSTGRATGKSPLRREVRALSRQVKALAAQVAGSAAGMQQREVPAASAVPEPSSAAPAGTSAEPNPVGEWFQLQGLVL